MQMATRRTFRWLLGVAFVAALGVPTVDVAEAARAKSRAAQVPSAKKTADVLVKLGSVRNGAGKASRALRRTVHDVSRESFAALPGIRVLREGAASAPADAESVVLVTARVRDLSARRSGTEIVYQAAVEYTLHRMPEQSIAATLQGRASARASANDLKVPGRAKAIRESVLEAAVASAIRQSSGALRAAAQH